ncbi:MAG: allantoinase AllB [Bacillota bacterium]|nr:allantoinase AllB [Bacillota bacterium]
MNTDLLIKNAQIVSEDGIVEGSLAVTGETIAAVLRKDDNVNAKKVIDAGGMLILPGAIDTHPHFFEPGPTYREDFLHGTRAAASGGFTTILDMPNTAPPVRDEETFGIKYKAASENSLIDFALWGSAMPTNISKINRLHELGCIAFKAFTLDAGPDFDFSGDFAQIEAMRAVKEFNGIYGAHAENGDIVKNSTALYRDKPWNLDTHEKARPYYAELSAINSLLLYAKITGCRLHICHMSIPEGAELIKIARENGVDVTVETCPHYLLLNKESAGKAGTFAMINPPLRSKERMEKMWDYVKDGTIDYIGTDHAPYTVPDKLPEDGDLWKANAGAPSIDIAVPALFEEAVINRKMPLNKFSALISTNAAKRFGLYPKKGRIAPGVDADFMILDADDPWVYTRAESFSKTKVTRFAYEGRRVACKVRATYLRGQAVFTDGKIMQEPGYGRFLRSEKLKNGL